MSFVPLVYFTDENICLVLFLFFSLVGEKKLLLREHLKSSRRQVTAAAQKIFIVQRVFTQKSADIQKHQVHVACLFLLKNLLTSYFHFKLA